VRVARVLAGVGPERALSGAMRHHLQLREAIDARADPGLVAAANRYPHAHGGRDEIRATQVGTYLRWISQDPADHPTRGRSGAPGLTLQTWLGFRLRRTEPVLARIDDEFVRWAQALRAAGQDFPRSHIWIRGFVATALAVEDRDRSGADRP
jgi:hypothetical protein